MWLTRDKSNAFFQKNQFWKGTANQTKAAAITTNAIGKAHYHLLSFTENPDEILKENRIDVFWAKMILFEGELGYKLFPNLGQFVLNVLSIAHSNASCERTFSKVNNIKTKLRNKLNNSSVTNIILAKESIAEKGGCPNFEPTEEMLSRMRISMYAFLNDIEEIDESIF